MTNVLSLTTCWKRPDVTELMFMGLERLKEYADFDITSLVVLSPEDPHFDELQDLCVKYDHYVTTHKNRTLGQKKNHGLQQAKGFDFDYLMDIDSDNIASNALMDKYAELIEQGNKFFGVTNHYIADKVTDKCYFFPGYKPDIPWGLRMIHRNLLDEPIWPDDKMAGMDMASQEKIKELYGVQPTGVDVGPQVIDIKTRTNLHLAFQFNGMMDEVPKGKLEGLIPQNEYDKLIEITKNPNPLTI